MQVGSRLNSKEIHMAKTSSEAKSRVMTGIVIAAVICGVILLSHIPAVLSGAVVILNVCAVYELFCAAHMVQERKLFWITVAGAAAISLIPIPRYEKLLLYVAVLAALIFAHIMRRCGRCILDVPMRICGICALVTVMYRAIPAVRNMEHGFFYLVLTVVVCCATDIMAYLTGKTFGKHRLCPKISPKKTVEGSIGGIIGAVLIALLVGWIFEVTASLNVNYPLLITYAIIASVIGQFGDLSMSAVKRCFGVKDFGKLFPGHGGVLDRFDSLLFTAPFTLLFCQYIGTFF